MGILDAILLGVVQGLTEFLPISSSGHLILARDVLGLSGEGSLAFDAALHLATALAIIWYFRVDIKKLVMTGYHWIRRQPTEQETLRLLIAILIGSIPAVIAGVLFGDIIEAIFRSAFSVAGALIIGSIIMLFAESYRNKSNTPGPITKPHALAVGFFQALALIPGMSRSGMTIAGGMLLGLTREQAARFTFLLALPVILGAGGMKFVELLSGTDASVGIAALLLGCLAAFLSGLVAVWGLMKLLRRYSLVPFVIYRVLLAVIVLLVSF